MKQVAIASRNELQHWLADKPRVWSIAVAARAALRVLPIMKPEREHQERGISFYWLPLTIFRATFVSLAAATGPADDTAVQVANDALVATRNAYIYDDAAKAALFAAGAPVSTDISTAPFAASASSAAANAATAAATASNRAANAADTLWRAVSNDAHTLATSVSGDAVAVLLQTPLWHQGDVPGWVHALWTELKGNHSLRNAGFTPWFKWYEGLLPLSGTTPIDHFGPALTRRIALQPREWWDRGAEAVNADIAAWLRERDALWDIPPQAPAAYQFTPEDGRIGLAPQDVTATDPAAAQVFLDDLRERAAQATQRLESARNIVPFLAAEVTRLRDFLPSATADLNPFLLRSRLVTIDAAVETLQTAGPSRELLDDPTMQVAALALAGRELMLCFPDLRTREREAIARAIPGHEREITEDLARVAEAAARAPEVVTKQAAAALETMGAMVREAEDGPEDARRDRIVEQVMVDRNLRSEAARFGWDLWDRVRPGVLDGAEAVTKHAVIFSFAGLVGALSHPMLGLAALHAGYGQVNHGLKLLREQFGKLAKELKESAEKPETDG